MLTVFVALAAAQAVQRGGATGRRMFGAVAGQLSADGVLRITLVVGLTALDRATVFSFCVACCVAAGGGLVVGGRLCPAWAARPRLRGDVPIKPILYLLVASVGPLLTNTGSAPWLAAVGDVDPFTLGAFVGAVTISRIPTLFVSALFGPLLSQLGHAVERGDEHTFHHLQRVANLAAFGGGAAFVIGFAVCGQWILSVFLGPEYTLGVANLALLAAASSLMFVAVVKQASLAALDRWAAIAIAWTVAAVVFVMVLALPLDALWRATLAPVVGVLAAVAALWLLAPRHLVVRPGTETA
jgi:O-antigen/teichoic acid export membrane protein